MDDYDTKSENFIDYTLMGNRFPVKEEVYKAIVQLENATDMEIARHILRERNFVTRARTDLITDGRVKEGIKRNCKITGRYVQTWEIGEQEKRPELLTATQMDKIEKMLLIANKRQKEIIKGWCCN
jgi:predicted transcriptional regulator